MAGSDETGRVHQPVRADHHVEVCREIESLAVDLASVVAAPDGELAVGSAR